MSEKEELQKLMVEAQRKVGEVAALIKKLGEEDLGIFDAKQCIYEPFWHLRSDGTSAKESHEYKNETEFWGQLYYQREKFMSFDSYDDAERAKESKELQWSRFLYGCHLRLDKDFMADWEDSDEEKYFIFYSYNKKSFEIDYCWQSCRLGRIYFSTKEKAQKAIRIAEHYIKKGWLKL